MQNYTDLKVWQKAHELVLEVYRLTAQFPKEERYGITSQLQRCTVSVAANLAEGSKRKSDPDFARFINMAEGSLSESDYYLLLTRDLGYVTKEKCQEVRDQIEEVARMLYGLRKAVGC